VPTQYQLTTRAVNDLGEIRDYIARDSVDAANRVESAIFAACASLARHPKLGTKRIDITRLPVRFWTVTRYPNFIVVYRPDTQPLQVVTALHGKGNLKELLQ
jgi:plasmid stabilization system protein ParE